MIWRGPKDCLEKHAGCRGCERLCQFNGPVANKEMAERSKRVIFECNSVG